MINDRESHPETVKGPKSRTHILKRTGEIFAMFSDDEDNIYGGWEIDYTLKSAAHLMIKLVLNPELYQLGNLELLETILTKSKAVVSVACGSGRMDAVFNDWMIGLGNDDYVYKGFDIADQPEKTRLEEWLKSFHPDLLEKVKIVFNQDFYSLESYHLENGAQPDLVIIHQAMDILFYTDTENKFSKFGPKLFELIAPGGYVLISMSGTNSEIVENFIDLGFQKVIHVKGNLVDPLVVIKKPE